MKRILCIMLVIVMLLGVSASAEQMITIGFDDITVTYNGEDVLFPDAKPLTQNGRTLVPVRPIMERAQLTVHYDASTKTVSAANDQLSISMQIDKTDAIVTKNGTSKTVMLDVPARIIDGRTYVPVRFVAESLGTKVNWNPSRRQVVIIDTNEWKQKLTENSDFLMTMLNLLADGATPYARDISGEYKYNANTTGFISENGPTAARKSVAFSFAGTSVFDGNNTGTFLSIETELPSLMPFFGASLTEQEQDALSGECVIDLEIITDKNRNSYVKSERIVKLLKAMGRTELATAIGDAYIKIPAGDSLFERLRPSLSALPVAANQTCWNSVEKYIQSDNYLFTQSVQDLNTRINQAASLFSKNYTVTPLKGNAKQWRYASSDTAHAQTVFSNAVSFATATGFPVQADLLSAQKEQLNKATVKTIIDVTTTDSLATRAEFIFSAKSAANNPNPYQLSINLGTQTRAFNAKTDHTVTLPAQVVPIESLRPAA